MQCSDLHCQKDFNLKAFSHTTRATNARAEAILRQLGLSEDRVREVLGRSVYNPQPSTLNPQPSTLNPQIPTRHPESIKTLDPKPLNP